MPEVPLEPAPSAPGGEQAESATAFLSEAGRTLASSLDYELTLTQVARLAVPTIADWCVIDMVDEQGGGLRRLAVAHVDPDKVRFALDLSRRYPARPDHPAGPHHVVRTGQPELVPEVTDALLEANAQDEEHLALLREVGFSSYMCVPLRARGTVLGVITCVAAESGRRFGTRDLALLEDLARTAAVAVDNALLFRDAEEARAAAEETLSQLDSLFSSAPVGLGFWDRELRCVRVNDSLAAINGVPADEHIGRTPTEVLGALGQEVEQLFERVLQTGQPITDLALSGHTPAAPGEERHWRVHHHPVLSGSGEVQGGGALVDDLTAGRGAEGAVRRGRSVLRLGVGGRDG